MSDVLWAALIGAVASIIVQVISTRAQNKKRAIDDAVKEAELNSRLENIENKLDTHNGYAEKIGGMAIDIAVIKTKIEGLQKN